MSTLNLLHSIGVAIQEFAWGAIFGALGLWLYQNWSTVKTDATKVATAV